MKEVVEDWYSKLVQDLKSLVFQGIVRTKWEISRRIVEDSLKFEKPEYGNKTIKNLAKDLEVSQRDIYYCIQFYKKYPDFATVLQNWSWHYITQYILPESSKQSEEIETPPLPESVFELVYADPPWKYDFSISLTRAIERQYPTKTEKVLARGQ